MTVNIRLIRPLYERMLEDLRRPHAFAFERVGFAIAKLGNLSDERRVVILSDYYPIADGQYIDDSKVGARINSDAIRAAMQRVLDSECGVFHVHLHAHHGSTNFSLTDSEGIPPVVAALRVAVPAQAHGMIVFSCDHARAQVWLPNESESTAVRRVTVVGYPLIMFDKE